jgi:acyl-CoA hydrolase/GNAT superfamily N-acetyltransferase
MKKQKPNYDPDWKAKYAGQIASAGEAVARVQSGQRVFIGTGCAEPQPLVRALTQRAGELADVEIVQLLALGETAYADRSLLQAFRVNSFFISERVRPLIQEGLGDYTPIFLSDIPRLFQAGAIPIEVALIQVSPPDAQGLCSLGVSVDIVKSAAANAALVIAQVNPLMPRTLGDSLVHVLDLDLLVPAEEPVLEYPPLPATRETERIAEFIAPLIEDGSTLELGIGRIPHALLEFLQDKKDLGIHTEMLSDGIVDLVRAGVITGRRKTLDRGKIVASFCLGTRRLYDFIDNNPLVSFHPTEYVNDPFIISRQHRMVAINVALEVDLTGQVCADSLGTKFFSGIGGQVDFNRGAARSEGGKAIIALPATARDGTVSRIVTQLSPGAGVVTTRGDVHYVATEFGVAYLHGKSIQERALALISIAHPRFQSQLLHEAIQAKYVSVELSDKEGMFLIGPRELRTTYMLRDGTAINFRPIHPTDEPRLRHLFYSLSQQTIYYRFMNVMKRMPHEQLDDFVFIDHRTEVAIVGTIPEASGEEIIAVGRYYLDPKTNRAEAAFTVQDAWQRQGVGSFMFRFLAQVARRNGIKGFTAEVLAENVGMQRVFNRSNYRTKARLSDGVYSYEIDF